MPKVFEDILAELNKELAGGGLGMVWAEATAALLVVRHVGSADKTALSGIDITLHA